jgi:UDP-N-acetylmuramate dehydrogenase
MHLDQPLALLTTYGVGGRASAVVTLRSSDEVLRFANVMSTCADVPIVVIGRGSNTLVSDSGFDGVAVVIATGDESRAINVTGDLVTASGAMLLPVLARRSAQAGRGGLEWCVGVPGTVGGAVRMNAGGHGAEIVDSVVSVSLVSLRSGVHRDIDAHSLGLRFRGSALGAHHVVVSATFRTVEADPTAGIAMIDDIVSWRREHQPGGRNAGSVFVNPSPGEGSAGALIDSLGLRGFTVGGANVSEKHANFIQASDGATASDIIAVMCHVQDVVAEKCGVVLRSEVRLVGFDNDVASRFGAGHRTDEANEASSLELGRLMGDQ